MTEMTSSVAQLRALLAGRAVRFGSFVLSSGKRSDLYVDLKAVFLEPAVLDLLGRTLVSRWQQEAWSVSAVGGMTLGADPLVAAFVLRAHDRGLDLPGFLVRKEPKGHGTGRYIEGAGLLPRGSRVLILEDVVTTGGSTVRTAERCRAEELEPVAALAVVDRSEGGAEAIRGAGLAFAALLARKALVP